MKPVPPPLDLRPVKRSEESKPEESADEEAAEPEVKAEEPSQPAEAAKPQAAQVREKSFSEMADESPDIAASVAQVLAKKVPPQADAAVADAPAESEPIVPESVDVTEPFADEDLDQEVEAALGGMSLDDILAGEEKATAKAAEEAAPETRVTATVLKVDREFVFFSLGSRNEGVAGLRQFKAPPAAGESMDVIIQKFDADEGLYEVTVPGASVAVADWGDLSEGLVVDAVITGHNTGGLECEVNHIRGFIPISQISLYRVENCEEFVGQKLACVVTEANPQRGNLVLSHRAMLEREREENRKHFFQTLEVGQAHEGTVRKLMDFGAFVEIAPGVDGLIHISQLSWDRVNHPSDVLTEGQKVQVRIEKIDAESGKIGLSYRELQDNPWNNVDRKYPIGVVVSGTVTRIAQFGAFVKLEPGVEGLVHISELAHHRVQRASSVVQEGQEVEVKVLEVDGEKQRISLSMKATQQPPAADAKPQAAEEEDEPPRELAVTRQRKGPLKGGTNKKTGGEDIGLTW